MNKIKVLFFMDGIGNAGGIQEMAIKWMENIDLSRYQIDILSYNTGKVDNYPERVKALGGKVYIIETYTRRGKALKSFEQTRKFFENHQYDIIHAHSSSKAFFVMWYAKKAGIQTRILHSHCTRFVVTKPIQRLIANLLKKPTKMLTTDYFACSPEAGAFLFGKRALEQGKIRIVHNGIDTTVFKPNENIRNRMREELNIENKYVIGNVGRFRPQKNHMFLMEIFKAIHEKDKEAVLVCVGDGELEDAVKKKAKEFGIQDSVMFLGFRKDVNDIMQTLDVLVMPSLFEGLPVTGVEAQAIGVPAVFATTITIDAAILPSSSYVALEEGPEIWANKILSYKGKNRETNPNKWILERGYDIKVETQKLEEFYMQSVRRG